MVVAENIDEKTLKRDGVCAASLPTTMGIVAGFLVQNTLKLLLGFGDVSNYVGYNAIQDFFPKMTLRPNPNCEDKYCRQRQKEYAAKPKPKIEIVQDTDVVPLHEDNEWGISLVDENEGLPEESSQTSLGPGLRQAYSVPSHPVEPAADHVSNDSSSPSLEELMQQMKSI